MPGRLHSYRIASLLLRPSLMLGFTSRRARFFVRLNVFDWVTRRRKRPPNRTNDRLLLATLLRAGRLHRRCSGILRDAIAASRKCQYGFLLSEEGKAKLLGTHASSVLRLRSAAVGARG